MRFRVSALLATVVLGLGAFLPAGAAVFYHVSGAPGAWPAILEPVGLRPANPAAADVIVLRAGAGNATAEIEGWLSAGKQVILEGASPAAAALGFVPGEQTVQVQSVKDRRLPELRIIWEDPLTLPRFQLPPDATIYAEERWGGAPIIAGMRRGKGSVLWIASTPGREGYERYPYILQALGDLGFQAPFVSKRLAVFFDYSYRIRVDLDYFAALWRRIGVGSLHVTAWPFWESDPVRDEYLKRLIEACHRQGISVYAWLELPHVSEKFWNDHPEWREKTALLQDAHLDWRKLMNLQNRDCFRAVSAGVEELVNRFDWDGINLAELYFESLQSYLNPSRFTPFNDDAREEFRRKHKFDPLVVWDKNHPLYHEKSIDGIRPLLDFRADLAKRMQEEWLAEMERIRKAKPDLDLILTHVDDRFDTQMRDAIGADAARLLPLLDKYDFTFLIEDPATIWHLGPKRYPELARRYAPITPRTDKLAIDINIVERYQDVYPTKKQTGTELFQLVHLASGAFPQVALYFENSILEVDRELLPASAAVVEKVERVETVRGASGTEAGDATTDGEKAAAIALTVPHGEGIRWEGPAAVNGKLWPYFGDGVVWLPAGSSIVQPASSRPAHRLVDFAGKLLALEAQPDGFSMEYESAPRAIVVTEQEPVGVLIDGSPFAARVEGAGGRWVAYLPKGRHKARVQLRQPEKESGAPSE